MKGPIIVSVFTMKNPRKHHETQQKPLRNQPHGSIPSHLRTSHRATKRRRGRLPGFGQSAFEGSALRRSHVAIPETRLKKRTRSFFFFFLGGVKWFCWFGACFDGWRVSWFWHVLACFCCLDGFWPFWALLKALGTFFFLGFLRTPRQRNDFGRGNRLLTGSVVSLSFHVETWLFGSFWWFKL